MQTIELGFLAQLVMPGLVPGIHVLLHCNRDVDGRDEPGHDVRAGLHMRGECRMPVDTKFTLAEPWEPRYIGD